MDSVLQKFERWYANQCNGEWEHDLGIEIGTLDNPGWKITINLAGTALEGRAFQRREQGLEDARSTDWHSIWTENAKFEGRGDPFKLLFILGLFLEWADSAAPK
jgi:hypothetical protein